MAQEQINLADPEFEPTDEQLQGLSSRAFASVAQHKEEALAKLTGAIEERRKVVMARIAPLLASLPREP